MNDTDFISRDALGPRQREPERVNGTNGHGPLVSTEIELGPMDWPEMDDTEPEEDYDADASVETSQEEAPAGLEGSHKTTDPRPLLDVTNTAEMTDWLMRELGRGPLSGFFARGNVILHCPYEGEAGYVPLAAAGESEDQQVATLRPVTTDYLAAQIQTRYNCVKVRKHRNSQPLTDKAGNQLTTKAMFPTAAARIAANAGPEAFPNLRKISSVVHSPVLRSDASVVETPGYDESTRLLYLPEPGLNVPAVPEEPTREDADKARDLLLGLIAGFPFLNEHHRANYLGGLLTPLLRNMTPAPWKLLAIGARQPGSGKTKLAEIIKIVHGGELSSDMPGDDTELRKQITSILTMTTGATVTWDNVTGAFRSPVLAGLLTSAVWGDRPLGVTQRVTRPNDRLWIVTGNNIQIGGDLARRTIQAVIDPGMSNPERRKFDFDPETWARRHKGELLHALLVLVRYWASEGMQLSAAQSSDGFATWAQVVQGILDAAGIGGTFDHPSTRVELGDDDAAWGVFLSAVREVFGDRPWTASEMLGHVGNGIPIETLPHASLAEKASRDGGSALAVTFGKWLAIRSGRIVGQLSARPVLRENGQPKKNRNGIIMWHVHSIEDNQ